MLEIRDGTKVELFDRFTADKVSFMEILIWTQRLLGFYRIYKECMFRMYLLPTLTTSE